MHIQERCIHLYIVEWRDVYYRKRVVIAEISAQHAVKTMRRIAYKIVQLRCVILYVKTI